MRPEEGVAGLKIFRQEGGAWKRFLLPPTSALEVILVESVPFSVYLLVWVCESYVVHHLKGTGLCCASLTCIVHHRPEYSHFVNLFVIRSGCDGTQYDVVSLAGFVGRMLCHVRVCVYRQYDGKQTSGRKDCVWWNVAGAWMLGHFHFRGPP